MKRSAAELRRLVRAQNAMADVARLEHRNVADALHSKNEEIASLERWAARPDAGTMRLLDLYVERTCTLAAQRNALADQERDARARVAGETARVRPLERRAHSAQMAEDRTAEEKQLGELLDRLGASANQASRKPRQP